MRSSMRKGKRDEKEVNDWKVEVNMNKKNEGERKRGVKNVERSGKIRKVAGEINEGWGGEVMG